MPAGPGWRWVSSNTWPGCGDAWPFYPGKRYLDRQLDDPAGKGVADVRPVRDEIERRVHALLAELAA